MKNIGESACGILIMLAPAIADEAIGTLASIFLIINGLVITLMGFGVIEE